MRDKYKEKTEGNCPYNKFVDCPQPVRCPYCGWNPKVSKRRLDAIKAALNKKE